MHSVDCYKMLRCNHCGIEYHYPLCDVYEYEGIPKFEYPKTEVGYCCNCQKFVCIQKGVDINEIINKLNKSNDTDKILLYTNMYAILDGRSSLTSCVKCGNTNVIPYEKCICPSCMEGKLEVFIEEPENAIRFHFRREYIKPVLSNKPKVRIKNDAAEGSKPINKESLKRKHNERKESSPFVHILRWIGILPVSIFTWIVVFWIVNLVYKIFSPVDMTQWAITIMSSGGSGMAFVLSGSLLAPKGKKIVSIVLATIMSFFALINLFFALYGYGHNSMIISIISALSTIIGCVFGAIQIHNEKY